MNQRFEDVVGQIETALDGVFGSFKRAILVLDAHDKAVRRRTLFTEVRAMLPPGAERDVLEQNGYEFFDYLNYVVDLDRDRDQLWNSIGKQTRAKIRRSHRRGMTIEHDTSVAGVHRIYPLLRASYARSRVPLAGIDLFLSALRFVSAGEIQIRIATHKGRDVAGTVGLYYRDRYFAWYGGTTRPQGIDPFAAIVWDEIEWAHQHGLRFYDFGGAGWPDEDYGPRTFKSRFHGALVCFGRYRKVYSRHRLALAEKGYESLRALFSQFPRETATDGADNDRSPVSERKPK